MAQDTSYAIRYAHAFAEAARRKGLDLLTARSQMKEFAALLTESPELREVLADPSIPGGQKLGVVDGIAERLGMLREVRNFLAIIIDHERIGELHVILDAYDRVADVDSGVTEAAVSTVHELDAEDRAEMEQQVARLAGTRVRVSYTLNSSLLGGAVVTIGSTVYDGSVRTQLEQMKQTLIGA